MAVSNEAVLSSEKILRSFDLADMQFVFERCILWNDIQK